MLEKIYIVGHKSPDLDSVAASIAYADLKNKLEATDKYVPRAAGELNEETNFVLEKFSIQKPEIIKNLAGESVILVDHNEFIQAVDGIEEAKIKEVVDHHKINFKYGEPVVFESYALGSSCTIVAKKYFSSKIDLSKEIAGILLAGILVDTIITKSPTCTEMDREIIEKLAAISRVDDWNGFGMELFKSRSSVVELSAAQIIGSDFKDFDLKVGKFGIGQVETVNLNEFASKEKEIKEELIKIKEGYHSVVFFITDIIKEGSKFFIVTDDKEKIEKALGVKLDNGEVYIPGIVSRKKQVTPKFMEVFDK